MAKVGTDHNHHLEVSFKRITEPDAWPEQLKADASAPVVLAIIANNMQPWRDALKDLLCKIFSQRCKR